MCAVPDTASDPKGPPALEYEPFPVMTSAASLRVMTNTYPAMLVDRGSSPHVPVTFSGVARGAEVLWHAVRQTKRHAKSVDSSFILTQRRIVTTVTEPADVDANSFSDFGT